MLFPKLLAGSGRTDDLTADQIDRSLEQRQQRLSTGIWIDRTFSNVQAALLITRGRGRFLQFRHASGISMEIPDVIGNGCRAIASGDPIPPTDRLLLLRDLADVQAHAVEHLKRQAGKYVDRILVTGVQEPGFWGRDFDGAPVYQSLCEATRLAERTGISVADEFPARDLAVDGNGELLEALPLWFLLADRDPRIARTHHQLVELGPNVRRWELPASDGRDRDVPPIECWQYPGAEFLTALAAVLAGEGTDDASAGDAAGGIPDPMVITEWIDQGKVCPELQQRLATEIRLDPDSGTTGSAGRRDDESVDRAATLIDRVVNVLRSAPGPRITKADQWISVRRWLWDQSAVTRPVADLGDPTSTQQAWWVAPMDSASAAMWAGFQPASTGSVDNLQHRLGEQVGWKAVAAAMLGLFQIDQLPGNVPRLTGATAQRVLGRITPGRPAQWRQVIREMSQYRPAPMKLKDAI